jgi:hypothetical protein
VSRSAVRHSVRLLRNAVSVYHSSPMIALVSAVHRPLPTGRPFLFRPGQPFLSIALLFLTLPRSTSSKKVPTCSATTLLRVQLAPRPPCSAIANDFSNRSCQIANQRLSHVSITTECSLETILRGCCCSWRDIGRASTPATALQVVLGYDSLVFEQDK